MAMQLYNPPAEGALFAAYRPIIMQCKFEVSAGAPASADPPVAYCDIYFNGVFYRTLSSTISTKSLALVTGSFKRRSVWTFDIQDAAQEYLLTTAPILAGTTLDMDPGAIAVFKCAFRDSSIDANGFIQPQTPAPVQGDFYTSPVAGGGTVADSGYTVINATLQHEDNPSLLAHLQSLTPAGYTSLVYMLNLTHRPPRFYINCKKQYDHWPVLVPWRGLDGSNDPIAIFLSVYWIDGNGVGHNASASTPITLPAAPMIYNIPTGIPQLQALSWVGGAPVWDQIASYQVFVSDNDGDFFTTGIIKTSGCCCSDGARLHFLNALGTYDAVNFCEREDTTVTKSSAWQRSLPRSTSWGKRDFGHQRFNVRANKEVVVRTNGYPEAAQDWLAELARCSWAYLEWAGTQGQPSDLVPVKISDGKVLTRKVEDRYEYVLELSYEMSNENIVQRG